jgi:hypothetical protein
MTTSPESVHLSRACIGRRRCRAASLAIVAFAMLAGVPRTHAQSDHSLSDVLRRLTPGVDVQVIDDSGRIVAGRVVADGGSGAGLVSAVDGVRLDPARIRQVATRGDSLLDGIAIGAAAGAAGGYFAEAGLNSVRETGPGRASGALVGALAGAGLGAVIDSLRRGHRVIYRRAATVSVLPIASAHASLGGVVQMRW